MSGVNLARRQFEVIDVVEVLPDWHAEAQATLLERPLFGFAMVFTYVCLARSH